MKCPEPSMQAEGENREVSELWRHHAGVSRGRQIFMWYQRSAAVRGELREG